METSDIRGQHKAPEDDVTASELAAFAYCAKAWHLERVVVVQVGTESARSRDGGVVQHERHGRDVRLGGFLGRRGRSMMLGLLALAVAFGLLAAFAA